MPAHGVAPLRVQARALLAALGLLLLGADQAQAQAVAARRIPRGAVLTQADIVTGPDSTNVQPGWVARRVINAGQPLRAPAVEPPRLVTAGQMVNLHVVQDGFRLTVQGRATSHGDLGDQVTVRLGPNRRIAGVITGPNQVTALEAQRSS